MLRATGKNIKERHVLGYSAGLISHEVTQIVIA